ncbi:archaellin/type IV pilin N-terminal domain-containing protein [Methanoculleus sp.]|jgi:flagellin FlaB|uniref:archaellin/type IV pilin N-terminal domain-containing protein n=1 Tax=Methanoculleus sp. TaxID=90427 RepID=UPI001BD468D7|nr:archaellin/type IV pilin N-terminal domain-containing protein [Methanoculleus sp.]
MRSLFQHDDAFTGLEAAIVLIAFIVVAAVFSYVVLGAGFFTTQKSQEVVHTGVQQASSSMEIIGNVYGLATTASSGLEYVKFTVGNTAGGTGLDVSKMVVTYTDEQTRAPDVAYSTETGDDLISVLQTAAAVDPDYVGAWGIIETINANDDTLLEPGEQFVIGVSVPTATTTVNTPFTVNLQPSVGAVFALKKTVPPAINPVNILY